MKLAEHVSPSCCRLTEGEYRLETRGSLLLGQLLPVWFMLILAYDPWHWTETPFQHPQPCSLPCSLSSLMCAANSRCHVQALAWIQLAWVWWQVHTVDWPQSPDVCIHNAAATRHSWHGSVRLVQVRKGEGARSVRHVVENSTEWNFWLVAHAARSVGTRRDYPDRESPLRINT